MDEYYRPTEELQNLQLHAVSTLPEENTNT